MPTKPSFYRWKLGFFLTLTMRKVKLEPNCYYHIYNRGINRASLFFNTSNWGFFLTRLRDYFDPTLAEMVAYCLMPNHYHFLVHIKSENFGLEVMQPFLVSYTKAINKQENRVGPLFQGPFQAKRIDTENTLVQVSQYIHLNPVLAGLTPHPAQWKFSSYLDYVGLRQGTFPQSRHVLAYFQSPSAYADFVMAGLQDKRLAQREEGEMNKGI
jgi:putative transposase